MHANEHPRFDPQGWRDRAACRGMDPALFIPAKPEHAVRSSAVAKAVCAWCPVIDECRAAHYGEPYGVWFGTTPDERGQGHGTYRGYRAHQRADDPPCRACMDAWNAWRRNRRAQRKASA